jgi:transcriptional regulator with XRE-family HTH domain
MTQPKAVSLRTKMLGALIREARVASGKSLKELAALIGTTSGTLSAYEHGRKGISLPELELLAYHLDLSLRRFWPSEKPTPTSWANFNPALLLSLRQRMIGARLKAAREAADLTQRDLAKHIGISPARLRAYESCERPIPIPELEPLLAALGHSVDEYIDTQGPVGEWDATKRAFEGMLQLPTDLRDFVSHPENHTYIRLAKQMSQVDVDRLRTVADVLHDLTQ